MNGLASIRIRTFRLRRQGRPLRFSVAYFRAPSFPTRARSTAGLNPSKRLENQGKQLLFQLPALFWSSILLDDYLGHWGAAHVIHRVVVAGVLTCMVLFLTTLSPAWATDLLKEVQQTAKSSQVVPVVPLQNRSRTASRDDSIFFFAGRLSTSNMGSTATFNTVAVDTTLIAPYYDNYIVGAAYQHRFRELGSGFVLGGEIGAADRFGH